MIGRKRYARANDAMRWLGDIEPLLAAADRFDAVAQNPNAFKPEVPVGAVTEDPSQSKSHDERKDELIEICQTIFGLSTRESLAVGAIAIEGIDQRENYRWGAGQLLVELAPFMTTQNRRKLHDQRDFFCVFVGSEVGRLFRPEAQAEDRLNGPGR
jgi:hypothetical protein